MTVFEAYISQQAADILNNELRRIFLFIDANTQIFSEFGLKNFFDNQKEYEDFKNAISETNGNVSECDRAEYGDFQTNPNLAYSVTEFLKSKNIKPKLIIEPTCGKGNFIIASLLSFSEIKKIVCVEIYKPYTWEAKFKIIDYFITNPVKTKPEIEINYFNVFDFDFKKIAEEFNNDEILIIGNPPWVTNAKLSCLESGNLPHKSNFKKHNGLDAITGKGNFDLGEYITLMMFNTFQYSEGNFAFLVKNTVIKNIVYDQKERKYNISNIQKLNIDSRKEFKVSVEASLLYCKLNSVPELSCYELNFYNKSETIRKFGWIKNKFVSDTELYEHTKDIDGTCPFEWRQGIKHDLSSIMELERINGKFVNGYNQEIEIEEDLVYGVLKSSDLKHKVISSPRKFTIITQKKTGQDTSFIKQMYPATFQYLQANKSLFLKRKSSIYVNKPDFSIFGIGDYSFAPYKVAISGLYKTFLYSIVMSFNNRPVMLDDTCYFLGFNNVDFAAYTAILLNSGKAKEFLQSVTFSDAKRMFTKEILMRINLFKLAEHFSESTLKREINLLNHTFNLGASVDGWYNYLGALDIKVEKNLFNSVEK